MTFDEFHNGIRVLFYIERDEFAAAVRFPQDFGAFTMNPHTWFVKSGDEDAMGLFAIVERRNAESKSVQLSIGRAQGGARLISAAPDLLAAAKLAVKIIESLSDALGISQDDEDLNAIKDAIAKAEAGAP